MVEILTAMQEAAKAGGDFAMSQLPDIAQQYVLYGRVSSTLFIAISLVVIALSVWLGIKYFKATEGISIIPAAIAIILAGIAFVVNASNFVMVWFAPKVWLIKEIAGLLK